VFSNPYFISLTHDGPVLVADCAAGVPAMQVWPDGTRQPQQLPSATANASAVLAINGDVASGLIVVSRDENRVERTGRTAWKRLGLKQPWAAVVVGDAVLVTENGAARVTMLDMGSGVTRATFGEETLKGPRGIAVGPSGEIVVADDPYGTRLVHVFDGQGRPLRSLGHKQLQRPWGVCVDGHGRVYVADLDGRAVVVLDCDSGAVLSRIAVDGDVHGVVATRCGQLVVSVFGGKSLLVMPVRLKISVLKMQLAGLLRFYFPSNPYRLSVCAVKEAATTEGFFFSLAGSLRGPRCSDGFFFHEVNSQSLVPHHCSNSQSLVPHHCSYQNWFQAKNQ
jgi:hypothetical protein